MKKFEILLFEQYAVEFEKAAKKFGIGYVIRNSTRKNGYLLIEVITYKDISIIFHLGQQFEVQVQKSIAKEIPNCTECARRY